MDNIQADNIADQNAVIVSMFDDISDALTQYAQHSLGADDPAKITDNQFCSVLIYLNHRYIRGIYDYYNKHNSGKEYKDYKTISDILDIYINLCLRFDKYISIRGFSLFSGIDDMTISSWSDKKSSPKLVEVYKKLIGFSEESLVNNLATGRKNPVGAMGILNNRFQWATSNNRQEHVTKIENVDDIRLALGVND